MFYSGVVEDRISDPLKLGRCKVRIMGLHTADKIELPTEDLPWAVLMQPVNSAATSGIGISPTGVVEGAVVIVTFLDEFKQQPVIVGTIAGIPTPHTDQTVKILETSESLAWKDETEQTQEQTTSGQAEAATGEKPPEVVGEVKFPQGILVPSEACYESIRFEEKLSSIVKGKNSFVSYEKYKTLPLTKQLYAYRDTKELWTIGWGSRYLLNKSEVTETTVITIEEADALLASRVTNEFAKGVQKALKAPVTQSMFDALVSIAYNTGVGGLTSSAMFAAVNAMNYEEAAALILTTRTNGNSLAARRSREKELFSKDGFPTKDMSTIEPAPENKKPEPDDATQNPVVSLRKIDNAGTSTIYSSRTTTGFRDPNGVYPKLFNEPDTHRLARHEKIDQTIVSVKEAARVTNIVSGGNGKWSQPKIPYNATYPYNQVKVTESGHVQEFDDTPGNERIHTYHRSGTFEEIDKNGTRVNRIVGDDFEILERNGNVLIKGSLNVTIVGNQNIRVENNANIDVLGNVNMTVGGNMNTGVTGDYKIQAGGIFSVDASTVWWNSGKSAGTPMGKGTAAGLPSFSTVETPTRNDEKQAQYETPEDGDPTNYDKKLESAGVTDVAEIPNPSGEPVVAPEVTESAPNDAEDAKQPDPVDVDCSMIKEPIPRTFKLSNNFMVSHLDPKNNLSSAPAVNITKQEIVCNMKALAENCLEHIKLKYPNMSINSGYRNYVPKGGATNSDHLYGAAVDINLAGFSRQQYFDAVQEIVKLLPAWTQVILEYSGNSSTWIHVAYNPKRGLKMQKFTMLNHSRYKDMGKFYLV